MAKTSIVEREKRRIKLSNKFYKKRMELKEIIISMTASDKDRIDAETKLQKLPRDSSYVRRRSRCRMCGRPRGTYKKFGLCRHHFRYLADNGLVPGTRKASW